MFTSSEILGKQFKTGIGYDKKDVEQFINELSSDFSSLQATNDGQKKKLKDLEESLNYYHSIERTLQKALVLAEKTAQDTRATAMREADSIEMEAKVKAKLMLADTKEQIATLEHKTLNLIQQYDMFKIHFENLLHAQMELLNSKSFSVNTEDFLYKEPINPAYLEVTSDITSAETKQSNPDNFNDTSMEDQDQIRFDFIKQPEATSYQTEDGFEFFTLKDE